MSRYERLDGPRAHYRRQALVFLSMRRHARRYGLPEREAYCLAEALRYIERERAASQ